MKLDDALKEVGKGKFRVVKVSLFNGDCFVMGEGNDYESFDEARSVVKSMDVLHFDSRYGKSTRIAQIAEKLEQALEGEYNLLTEEDGNFIEQTSPDIIAFYYVANDKGEILYNSRRDNAQRERWH